MLLLAFIATLLTYASVVTAESNHELLLSLNKDLLRSLDTQDGLPNPSIHLALRLSNYHNLAKEAEYLNKLKNALHNDIQSSLLHSQPVTGIMALYILALKSSCYNISTITFTINGKTQVPVMQLKTQMDQEKKNFALSGRPLTNYYQYSLGVIALCVSGVRVNNHVTNKLIIATEYDCFKHGDIVSIDTYAMAGMALQCVKDAGYHVHNAAELDTALAKIKQKLLASRRTDGHLGNEFSTGNAVQALLAMGSPVTEFAASTEAIRTSVRANVYHNPMGMSQILPALHQKSYLSLRNKKCLNEDDTLVLEPEEPELVESTDCSVNVKVEVVKHDGTKTNYALDVPTGSTLLKVLELLKGKNVGFTFEVQTSLWGPFLSAINGEQARQSDKRYWHLSSDGSALNEGVGDYTVENDQKIGIQNKGY
ncbi:transcobalamin-2 [Brachionichthys hirsutus]|uniref:transcobalamin-2 n=1 Tax=Brachionichthys hirsutus TaxID=412623 RepID=UPI003604CA1D